MSVAVGSCAIYLSICLSIYLCIYDPSDPSLSADFFQDLEVCVCVSICMGMYVCI